MNWHGVAETEVMDMFYRDCFQGCSAVAERDLVMKFCVLPHVVVPDAAEMS